MIYIFIALAILVLILGIYHFNKQRKINDFLIQSIDQHILEVENMYNQMRGIRHDYISQIQVLKAHLQLNQMNELEKYLDQMDHELNQIDTIIMSGNIMIDALVNSKLTLAKNNGIQLNAKAIVPQELPFADLDLGILIGNILSNAYESSSKSNEKFIRLYIAPIKGNLYISCTNSTLGKVTSFTTLKKGEHGFGLERINQVVNKYEGWINRKTEDDVFITEVYLPLKEQI
ncbi:MAG TPA: GHKL domain-containing protein [Erysipelothrix sp.]|nr:GHKL domain-containing protein [Erysipelothrix sp.]